MGILRVITYVLASLASLCVITASAVGLYFAYSVGSALAGLGSTPAVSTVEPFDPGNAPGEGMTDDEWKATLDPECVERNPDDWATACAG